MKKNNGNLTNKKNKIKNENNKQENNKIISEIVSKLILDKIILLSNIEITNKEREKHISEITFEFSKNLLDNIVNIKYIKYDKDENNYDCNEIESPNLIDKDRDMYNKQFDIYIIENDYKYCGMVECDGDYFVEIFDLDNNHLSETTGNIIDYFYDNDIDFEELDEYRTSETIIETIIEIAA